MRGKTIEMDICKRITVKFNVCNTSLNQAVCDYLSENNLFEEGGNEMTYYRVFMEDEGLLLRADLTLSMKVEIEFMGEFDMDATDLWENLRLADKNKSSSWATFLEPREVLRWNIIETPNE